MAFVEYVPQSDSQAPRQGWTLLFGPFILFGLLLVNIWPRATGAILGRSRQSAADGEWLAAWDWPRFGCAACNGTVRQFEYRGRAVAAPASGSTRGQVCLATPIGVFCSRDGAWYPGHWEASEVVWRDEFRPDEQFRGYYETTYIGDAGTDLPREQHETHRGWPVYRKRDTPPDWCLLEGAPPYWIDPARLDELVAHLRP